MTTYKNLPVPRIECEFSTASANSLEYPQWVVSFVLPKGKRELCSFIGNSKGDQARTSAKVWADFFEAPLVHVQLKIRKTKYPYVVGVS